MTAGTVRAGALQWVVSPQICSILKQWHICSFPAWICLYIINGSPRRGSCLQLVSKARADTELPLLLTKRLSDRGCTSNTGESKENCRGSNNARATSPLQKLGWLAFPSAALVPKNPLGGFTFAGSRLLTCSALVITAVKAIIKTTANIKPTGSSTYTTTTMSTVTSTSTIFKFVILTPFYTIALPIFWWRCRWSLLRNMFERAFTPTQLNWGSITQTFQSPVAFN